MNNRQMNPTAEENMAIIQDLLLDRRQSVNGPILYHNNKPQSRARENIGSRIRS